MFAAQMCIYIKANILSGYPRVLGHELCGVVADVGKGVRHFSIGQRVSADPNIFCEGCPACKQNKQNFCEDFVAVGVTRHGAFTQYGHCARSPCIPYRRQEV